MPASIHRFPVAGVRRAARTRAARTRAAWIVLTVLLLFSIAAPLNQSKVPPILPLLMDAFALSVGQAGWLNAAFAVTGLLLALPAGLILQRLGSRLKGLLAGGSIMLGALLGVTSATIGSLLAGRIVERIGASFMAVLAPATIAVWFGAPAQPGDGHLGRMGAHWLHCHDALGMLLMTAILPLTGFVPAGAIVIVIVAQGVVGGLVPANIFSAGVEVAGDARLSGLAMGVIMFGQNAGMLAGPAVFGGLVESAGWPAAYASLSIMCLAGLAAGWLAKARYD